MKQDLANTETWSLYLLRMCLRLPAELLFKNNFLIKKEVKSMTFKNKVKSQFNDSISFRCKDKHYICAFLLHEAQNPINQKS